MRTSWKCIHAFIFMYNGPYSCTYNIGVHQNAHYDSNNHCSAKTWRHISLWIFLLTRYKFSPTTEVQKVLWTCSLHCLLSYVYISTMVRWWALLTLSISLRNGSDFLKRFYVVQESEYFLPYGLRDTVGSKVILTMGFQPSRHEILRKHTLHSHLIWKLCRFHGAWYQGKQGKELRKREKKEE